MKSAIFGAAGASLTHGLNGPMSTKGPNTPDERLQDLSQRLDETLANRNDKDGPDPTDSMAAGFAMRAITEILVALAVCTIAGYYLDRYFGTTPWIMIILMPLGQAAGVWNVMRLSRTKQADAIMGGKVPPAASVKDDDDED
jgi:ATP synthase protein I